MVKVNLKKIDLNPGSNTFAGSRFVPFTMSDDFLKRDLYIFSLSFRVLQQLSFSQWTFTLRNEKNEIIYNNAEGFKYTFSTDNTAFAFNFRNGRDFWNFPVNAYVDFSKSTYQRQVPDGFVPPEMILYYAFK